MTGPETGIVKLSPSKLRAIPGYSRLIERDACGAASDAKAADDEAIEPIEPIDCGPATDEKADAEDADGRGAAPEEKADPAAGATRPNSFSVGAGAVGASKL